MTAGFWFQLNNSRLGSSLLPFVFPTPGVLLVGSRSSTEILDFLENMDGLEGLYTLLPREQRWIKGTIYSAS